MKVWLNNLKEGDIFYMPNKLGVLKCIHLGKAHNMNFRMSRIKYKIIEGLDDDIKKFIGEDGELFVNQYVYDDYESANEVLNKIFKKELEDIQTSIIKNKAKLIELEEREKYLKNKLN